MVIFNIAIYFLENRFTSLANGFKDCHHVSNVDSLAEEVLQYLLCVTKRNARCAKFGNDGLVRLFGVFQQS